MPSPKERFKAKYEVRDCGHETPCWTWFAYRDRQGYGRAWYENRSALAHRVSYEWANGPIPEGLQLDHLCRNPSCVNPEHLEPVTNAENQRRGLRANQTHCANGHEFTEANTYHRPEGGRDCRICVAERQRRYKQRQAVA